ncbi:unnamed protein product, partial [Amoebophrya sp. A120]|eukprot:GSA120T00023505001.1
MARMRQQMLEMEETKRELAALKNAFGEETSFVRKALARVRWCGAITVSLIRFLLESFICYERVDTVFGFYLLLFAYVSMVSGTLMPVKMIFFPHKILLKISPQGLAQKVHAKLSPLGGRFAATTGSSSSGDHPGGDSTSEQKQEGEDAGDERTGGSLATMEVGRATAPVNVKAEDEQRQLPEETGADAEDLDKPSTRTEGEDQAQAQAPEYEEGRMFPRGFLAAGTLSCVCQDSDSAEGKLFTLFLVLYMMATLVSQYPFHAYRSFCLWRTEEMASDRGDLASPRMSSDFEIALRAVWLVVPTYFFVVTAVIQTHNPDTDEVESSTAARSAAVSRIAAAEDGEAAEDT